MKKHIFIVLVSCLLTLTMISCSGTQKISKDNLPANSVYSQSLGKVVSLNMPKEKVDELLGSGSENEGYYIYKPDNLSVQYADGKVSSLSCQYPNKDWITRGKFTIDSGKADIEKYYDKAKNKAESDKNELIYGYGADDVVTDTNAKYGIAYIFGIDDKVKTFSITNVQ